jgi:hypothetical protein
MTRDGIIYVVASSTITEDGHTFLFTEGIDNIWPDTTHATVDGDDTLYYRVVESTKVNGALYHTLDSRASTATTQPKKKTVKMGRSVHSSEQNTTCCGSSMLTIQTRPTPIIISSDPESCLGTMLPATQFCSSYIITPLPGSCIIVITARQVYSLI